MTRVRFMARVKVRVWVRARVRVWVRASVRVRAKVRLFSVVFCVVHPVTSAVVITPEMNQIEFQNHPTFLTR